LRVRANAGPFTRPFFLLGPSRATQTFRHRSVEVAPTPSIRPASPVVLCSPHALEMNSPPKISAISPAPEFVEASPSEPFLPCSVQPFQGTWPVTFMSPPLGTYRRLCSVLDPKVVSFPRYSRIYTILRPTPLFLSWPDAASPMQLSFP